ncbi:MAG TPA: hypothetical protein CFH84_11595 [Sulfurimonas sp. UBA12504]|nr:MAG TPA: hypothetical protein CFH84_11595 [Sulfurimonas sp. UBA12504]
MTELKDFPKITVITATYNAEKYLEQTIKSVMGQEYPNIEYIIIDGASTDGTLDIIKKYENFITYWVSEPDKGVYDAMNKGVEKASGQWINFMNAGDNFYACDTISKVIPYLRDDLKVLCGYVNCIDTSHNWLCTEFPMNIENIHKEFRINHQAAFTKMDVAKNSPFDLHYKYASDVDFFMKIGLDTHCYKILPFPVVDFLQGGLWQQHAIHANIEILNIASSYLPRQEDIFEHSAFLELHFGLYKRLSSENEFFSILLNKFIPNIKSVNDKYKKIILYGYGLSGEICKHYLADNLIGIIDKRITKTKGLFLTPQMLQDIDYDCVLISVLGREKEIEKYLVEEYGVDKNKIISINL